MWKKKLNIFFFGTNLFYHCTNKISKPKNLLMKNMNLIGVAGAVLFTVAIFLPWKKMGDFSVSGWATGEPAAKILLGAGILGAIMFVMGSKVTNIVGLLVGLGGLGLSIKCIMDASGMQAIGLYLLTGGALVMCIGGVMGMMKKPAA